MRCESVPRKGICRIFFFFESIAVRLDLFSWWLFYGFYHEKPTIWEIIVGAFSKHRRSKSKCKITTHFPNGIQMVNMRLCLFHVWFPKWFPESKCKITDYHHFFSQGNLFFHPSLPSNKQTTLLVQAFGFRTPGAMGSCGTRWAPNFVVTYNPSWLVVSNIFYVHPYLGKISILTNIFQGVETTT